ncbi:MAG: hypothetical protein J6T20_04705 [Treponema sp.]|nr:hypothetical protein [Treponema sp.]
MCNCLSEVIKVYRKNTRDENADILSCFLFDKGEVPIIIATHRYQKKDGTFANKIVKETIIPTYCPFCGKKI